MNTIIIFILVGLLILLIIYYRTKICRLKKIIVNFELNVNEYNENKKIYESKIAVRDFSYTVKHHFERNNKYTCNKKLKILIADYNEDSASKTSDILENMGFETIIAPSGIDALNELKSTKDYDLLITNNIFKNSFDGKDLLDSVKQIKSLSIPVVVLTTSINQRDEFINKYGFDEYLTKPLTFKQVREIFPRIINNIQFKKMK